MSSWIRLYAPPASPRHLATPSTVTALVAAPKRNQLTLTKSPPGPENATYRRCRPAACAVTAALFVVQAVQPPVGVMGMLAMTGPVTLSSRYSIVPDDAPDAT